MPIVNMNRLRLNVQSQSTILENENLTFHLFSSWRSTIVCAIFSVYFECLFLFSSMSLLSRLNCASHRLSIGPVVKLSSKWIQHPIGNHTAWLPYTFVPWDIQTQRKKKKKKKITASIQWLTFGFLFHFSCSHTRLKTQWKPFEWIDKNKCVFAHRQAHLLCFLFRYGNNNKKTVGCFVIVALPKSNDDGRNEKERFESSSLFWFQEIQIREWFFLCMWMNTAQPCTMRWSCMNHRFIPILFFIANKSKWETRPTK